jgi:hypothetical protein
MNGAQVGTMVLLDKMERAESLPISEALDLRNVSQARWPVVLSAIHVRDLRLYHLTIETLDGIQQLTGIARLSLEWAPKITSLKAIFEMASLKYLWISDFAKLRSLAGIEALTNLVDLHLSGNRGSLNPPLRLESIRPIGQMKSIQHLSLTNMRLDDDDIRPLAGLRSLRTLELSNNFDRTQFAYLARCLNAQLEEKITASRPSSTKCRKCGGVAHLFLGRKMPFVCRDCEADKFQKLEAEFEQLVRAA